MISGGKPCCNNDVNSGGKPCCDPSQDQNDLPTLPPNIIDEAKKDELPCDQVREIGNELKNEICDQIRYETNEDIRNQVGKRI
jgi:hypothetical protein